MKKPLTHSELNNVLIEQLVEFLTIAYESADLSEKERGFINDDLDTINVAYFGNEPDGDNQWSIKESGLELTFAMAFSILTTRIENSCFVFEIEKSETKQAPGLGTHKIEFEYQGEKVSFEITPDAEYWREYIDVKTEKSEFLFEIYYDEEYNEIAVYESVDAMEALHTQQITKKAIKEETEIEIDLFENYELLPVEVQKVINRYGDLDEPTYDNCEAMLTELEPLGFTFEYELDAIPYDLRPIEKSESLKLITDIVNNFYGKSIFEYEHSWPRVQNTLNRYERNDLTLTFDEETNEYQLTLTGIKTNPTTSLVAINQILELYNRD